MEDNNASKISCYNNNNNNSTCSSNSSRQSSTRWSPTSEQIRILKDLYYNNGVRSPTAEQIQRISAKLRQFGKIEGKNVFYWFQNHKARERQKKRFTTTDIRPPPPPPPQIPNYNRYHHQQQPDHHIYYNKFTPAAGGFLNYGYGSMEIGQQQQQHHPAWAGFHHDPYSYPYSDQTLEMQTEGGEGEAEGEERETLPLFPIHGDAIRPQTSDYGYSSNNYFNATSSSLELSLSSSYSFSRFHTTIN